MRARTRDAVEMHDCRTRCRRETSPTSPTAVANLKSVFARVSQQDQVIMQSGSQALATLRSHVPPLLRCMCDESLIPHVTLDLRLHAPSLPALAQGRGLPTPTAPERRKRRWVPWKQRFNIGRRHPLQSLRPSARLEFPQADNRRMTSQSPPTSIRRHGTGRTTHESTPFSRTRSARRSRHAPCWPLRRSVQVSRPRFALMRCGAQRTRACTRHHPRLQFPHRLARAPPLPLLHHLLRLLRLPL